MTERKTPFDDAQTDEEHVEAMRSTLMQVFNDATAKGMNPVTAAMTMHNVGEVLKVKGVENIENRLVEDDDE